MEEERRVEYFDSLDIPLEAGMHFSLKLMDDVLLTNANVEALNELRSSRTIVLRRSMPTEHWIISSVQLP